MAEFELRSPSYEVDEGEAVEFYYDRGWSDGLPVVPPTEERVKAMLSGAGLEPDAQIAFIQTRQAAITAEKAAINAVLAGCRPEYMPVIVAALEALDVRPLQARKAIAQALESLGPQASVEALVKQGLQWEAAVPITGTGLLGEIWLTVDGKIVPAQGQPQLWHHALFYLAALEAFGAEGRP